MCTIQILVLASQFPVQYLLLLIDTFLLFYMFYFYGCSFRENGIPQAYYTFYFAPFGGETAAGQCYEITKDDVATNPI